MRHEDLRLKNKINYIFIFVFPLANNNQRNTINVFSFKTILFLFVLQMQPQTNKDETQATKEQGTESLPTEYIDRKDKCKGIYKFPSAIVYDFNKYVLIKDEFEDVYRFSTV